MASSARLTPPAKDGYDTVWQGRVTKEEDLPINEVKDEDVSHENDVVKI